jgi:hypothetical protein
VLLHADYSDWDVSASLAARSLAYRGTEARTLIDNAANTDDPSEMA